MDLHTAFIAAVGTVGVLLAIASFGLIFRPRRLWTAWFGIERHWRHARFGDGWSPLESALQRRGYFWVPRDIELRSPDDVHAYALSDRFWRSGYAWFIRVLCWYAGAVLIFFAFILLGIGL